MNFEDTLKYDERGLIPVITQDVNTGTVLMHAYANKEAVKLTIETKKAHYFSRSRKSLWLKGETSGHFQYIEDILYDCDCDTLLYKVKQEGAACHTGKYSCFYRNYLGEEIM